MNKAVEPPGEARSDFDIFLETAKRIGCYETLFKGWAEPKDAFDEWGRISQGRLCDYSQMTYERLDRENGIQWGGPRLYADGIFQTEDGKAKLWAIECHEMPEAPNNQFPFLLNTGRTVEHWHTRTKTGRIEVLEKMSPEAWVEIHPDDARRLKLKQHDAVRVRSQRGSIEKIHARITGIVRPGHLFIPFHYIEACANNLTVAEFDPISREPNYKQCAVRVERL